MAVWKILSVIWGVGLSNQTTDLGGLFRITSHGGGYLYYLFNLKRCTANFWMTSDLLNPKGLPKLIIFDLLHNFQLVAKTTRINLRRCQPPTIEKG